MDRGFSRVILEEFFIILKICILCYRILKGKVFYKDCFFFMIIFIICRVKKYFILYLYIDIRLFDCYIVFVVSVN